MTKSINKKFSLGDLVKTKTKSKDILQVGDLVQTKRAGRRPRFNFAEYDIICDILPGYKFPGPDNSDRYTVSFSSGWRHRSWFELIQKAEN